MIDFFTFQSGYIQIESESHTKFCCQALHSNLVIFKSESIY